MIFLFQNWFIAHDNLKCRVLGEVLEWGFRIERYICNFDDVQQMIFVFIAYLSIHTLNILFFMRRLSETDMNNQSMIVFGNMFLGVSAPIMSVLWRRLVNVSKRMIVHDLQCY